MKTILTILTFILFFTQVSLLAQHNCGTHCSSETIQRLQENQEAIDIYTHDYELSSSRTDVKVPLQIHIIRNNNGQSGLSMNDLTSCLNYVNGIYAQADIEFFICGEINYINSSNFHSLDYTQEDQIVNQHYTPNKINIYFSANLTADGGQLCGYTYLPNSGKPDILFMNNECTPNGKTMAHEMGHFFGLYHTHGKHNCGTLTDELVNGSNCSTAGDNICDTPADPNLYGPNCDGNLVNNNCQYNGNYTDANGHYFEPDPSNLMAYTMDQCQNRFTNGQYARIKYHQENYRTNLQCDDNPPSGTDGDGLQMFASLEVNPAPLCIDQDATVSFDVVNRDNQTFEGFFTIDLHSSNGDWIEELDRTNTTSLPTDNHFSNGITFQLNEVNIPEGEYQIWAWAFDNSSGDWVQIGNESYSNYKVVTVNNCSQSGGADPFEANDNTHQAYLINMDWNQPNASFETQNTNIHMESDRDYFKLELEAGKRYFIDARIHDSYESEMGTFTNDGAIRYKVDNGNWSEWEDSQLQMIELEGAHTIYFHMESWYEEEMGSYAIDINVDIESMDNSTSVGTLSDLSFDIFPNPSVNFVEVKLNSDAEQINSITIFTMQGKAVFAKQQVAERNAKISVNQLPTGTYMLVAQTTAGSIVEKIIVGK